jgi:hypothetical protein
MLKACLIVLALALTGCTQGVGSASLTPTSAAPASGLCIDRGLLADNADTVTVGLQGIAAALKAGKADQARSLATGAVSGLRSIADLVEPAKPDAAKDFRGAADRLEGAATTFPGGMPSVEEVQTEFETAYMLARTVACPA